MPGWAMLEELTLGDLSHLYKGLAKDADKKAVARRLGLPAPLLHEPTPYIFDVTTATFDQAVIENSFHKPVLVDFWA
eukprot:gene17461-17290_t